MNKHKNRKINNIFLFPRSGTFIGYPNWWPYSVFQNVNKSLFMFTKCKQTRQSKNKQLPRSRPFMWYPYWPILTFWPFFKMLTNCAVFLLIIIIVQAQLKQLLCGLVTKNLPTISQRWPFASPWLLWKWESSGGFYGKTCLKICFVKNIWSTMMRSSGPAQF